MPVQIEKALCLEQIDQEIAVLEKKYGMSTAEFLALQESDVVSSFDSIEWCFLLDSKKVLK